MACSNCIPIDSHEVHILLNGEIINYIPREHTSTVFFLIDPQKKKKKRSITILGWPLCNYHTVIITVRIRKFEYKKSKIQTLMDCMNLILKKPKSKTKNV